MSGAADDDSAPSTSTPQSPEGVEGAPDVTVAESKPDTPGSHVEDDAAPKSESNTETAEAPQSRVPESPMEQPSQEVDPGKEENNASAKDETIDPVKDESTEPAKEENSECTKEDNMDPVKEESAPHDEEKKDAGDATVNTEEGKLADGESDPNTSEDPVALEEGQRGEPAPETGETDHANPNEANLVVEEEAEALPSADGKVETGENERMEEKEVDKAEDDPVPDDSAKETENLDNIEVIEKTESGDKSELDNAISASESTSVNTNANNDASKEQVQNDEPETLSEIPDSHPDDSGSKKGENGPDTTNPSVAASNVDSEPNVVQPSDSAEEKQSESIQENSTNPDNGEPNTNNDNGDAPLKHEDSSDIPKVELSELDSVKMENEQLKKRVKDLENEIEGIKEGRKEGMKIQADYLARELSQQQDTEKYLREKLAEEKEESERRVKDFQLRLKRFAKDDQAKDARVAKMEKELQDITNEVQLLENMLDADALRSLEERRGAGGKVNGPSGAGSGKSKAQPSPPQSKTCVIL